MLKSLVPLLTGFRLLYIRTSIFLITSALLASCSHVDQTSEGSRLYLGIVKVRSVKKIGVLSASSIQVLGAGWSEGHAFAGWSKEERVESRPEDCQILIIIRSNVQVSNVKSIIQNFGGLNPCIADYTK